mmetsp:Transcript_8532/g.14414  ORF Transcript_8532/g.14414 Transcript_8532/m.14414 type:complete len:314 (+) Transcript_8532:177-1118(+)
MKNPPLSARVWASASSNFLASSSKLLRPCGSTSWLKHVCARGSAPRLRDPPPTTQKGGSNPSRGVRLDPVTKRSKSPLEKDDDDGDDDDGGEEDGSCATLLGGLLAAKLPTEDDAPPGSDFQYSHSQSTEASSLLSSPWKSANARTSSTSTDGSPIKSLSSSSSLKGASSFGSTTSSNPTFRASSSEPTRCSSTHATFSEAHSCLFASVTSIERPFSTKSTTPAPAPPPLTSPSPPPPPPEEVEAAKGVRTGAGHFTLAGHKSSSPTKEAPRRQCMSGLAPSRSKLLRTISMAVSNSPEACRACASLQYAVTT